MRWVLNLGTQLATTRRWLSFSAGGAGKEGSGVSVGADAQEDQIKARELAGR